MSDPIRDAAQARAELRQTDAAFEAIKQNAIEGIVSSTLDQSERRETLYRVIQTVDAVRQQLFQIVATGEMEQVVADRQKAQQSLQ